MRVLREYADEHLVLVVTHDRSILQDADRIIEIWDGRISAVKETER
jgi:putative ABC transport system ATP-binding protein